MWLVCDCFVSALWTRMQSPAPSSWFPLVSLMAGIGVLQTSNYSEILVGGEQHIDNLGLNISFVLKSSPGVHHFYFLNFML